MLQIHLIGTSVRAALICRDTAGGAATYRMDPCATPFLYLCSGTLNFSWHLTDRISPLGRRSHNLCWGSPRNQSTMGKIQAVVHSIGFKLAWERQSTFHWQKKWLSQVASERKHKTTMLVKMNSELSEIIHLDGFYSIPPGSMETSHSVI